MCMCVGVPACPVLRVFSVCIYASLHVGECTCLVMRLLSPFGFIFAYLTFAYGNSSESVCLFSFSANYMKHKNNIKKKTSDNQHIKSKIRKDRERRSKCSSKNELPLDLLRQTEAAFTFPK